MNWLGNVSVLVNTVRMHIPTFYKWYLELLHVLYLAVENRKLMKLLLCPTEHLPHHLLFRSLTRQGRGRHWHISRSSAIIKLLGNTWFYHIPWILLPMNMLKCTFTLFDQTCSLCPVPSIIHIWRLQGFNNNLIQAILTLQKFAIKVLGPSKKEHVSYPSNGGLKISWYLVDSKGTWWHQWNRSNTVLSPIRAHCPRYRTGDPLAVLQAKPKVAKSKDFQRWPMWWSTLGLLRSGEKCHLFLWWSFPGPNVLGPWRK